MSSLLKLLPLRQLTHSRPAVIYNVARSYADYRLEQLIPGPYPDSKKAREEAAKKYGLLPQEYEPFPDDGFGQGDYPNLPDIGGDARGPHHPWDYPEHRRDFDETWHAYTDLIATDKDDPQEWYPYPLWKMVLMHVAFMGTLVSLFYFMDDYKIGPPVLKKQYPHHGHPHYTFEPASELD